MKEERALGAGKMKNKPVVGVSQLMKASNTKRKSCRSPGSRGRAQFDLG